MDDGTQMQLLCGQAGKPVPQVEALLGAKERQGRRDELLAELNLSARADQRADTLSGGETRRVEIARALASDPRYMLLDEPFTGIDPRTVEDIQSIVADLRAKGLSLLITDFSAITTRPATLIYSTGGGRNVAIGVAAALAFLVLGSLEMVAYDNDPIGCPYAVRAGAEWPLYSVSVKGDASSATDHIAEIELAACYCSLHGECFYVDSNSETTDQLIQCPDAEDAGDLLRGDSCAV